MTLDKKETEEVIEDLPRDSFILEGRVYKFPERDPKLKIPMIGELLGYPK